MKISVILGTRPEAIKLAPVILALRRDPDIRCTVCVTAQHRQMLDQVLRIFGIQPDVDLNMMTPDQSLAHLTARCLNEIDHFIAQENPDLILVQGDTTTVLAAALAAFYRRVAVGHVEAGLRTWNLDAPWPEEANRVLTTRLAKLHFAPTETAKTNLLREGVRESDIAVTGNTVIDALFLALDKIRVSRPLVPELPMHLQSGEDTPLVLITGHRRESFGNGFENICHSILELSCGFPDVHFVYPVHLNPNVREPVMRILSRRGGDNIHLIEPLSYLPFVWLMNRSTLILTDSGGIQEEAPSLGKPVLVMRNVTERPEAVAAGTVRLVGQDRELIVSEVTRLLTDPAAYAKMSQTHNPYGDGLATERIVRRCKVLLGAPAAEDPREVAK